MPAAPRTTPIPYRPDDVVLPTKYRLIRRLGQGGFAEVWEAQNSFMDRIDAIKIILPRFAGRYSAQQIAKEARIPNALRHLTPHVADVFDAGITERGLPYIVMELLKGNTLRERLTKRAYERRPFEIKNVVGIGAEIVHALAHAHALKIVHLDIKPENVFLAKQYDQGVETMAVKVLDFGLAKLFENRDAGTCGVGIEGTPRYAAPEQFSNVMGTIGPWSDVYAIGHILYESVVGHPTFEPPGVKLDRAALEITQLTTEPVDVREFRADVPLALAALIHRCLQKRPMARPQTATELARALDELDQSLRHKRPVVSLAAISDVDLKLDALKLDMTTEPSPMAAVVAPHWDAPQVVHGPSYVAPYSPTEAPDARVDRTSATNESVSFLSERPDGEDSAVSGTASRPAAAPLAPVTMAPIVLLGAAATDVGGAGPAESEPFESDSMPDVARAWAGADITDPDPPGFLAELLAAHGEAVPSPPPAEPAATTQKRVEMVSPRPMQASSHVDDEQEKAIWAPPHFDDEPSVGRYRVVPNSGPMGQARIPRLSGAGSLDPIMDASIPEDRSRSTAPRRSSLRNAALLGCVAALVPIAMIVASRRTPSPGADLATAVETTAISATPAAVASTASSATVTSTTSVTGIVSAVASTPAPSVTPPAASVPAAPSAVQRAPTYYVTPKPPPSALTPRPARSMRDDGF